MREWDRPTLERLRVTATLGPAGSRIAAVCVLILNRGRSVI
jgi:hypothetical protein